MFVISKSSLEELTFDTVVLGVVVESDVLVFDVLFCDIEFEFAFVLEISFEVFVFAFVLVLVLVFVFVSLLVELIAVFVFSEEAEVFSEIELSVKFKSTANE